MAWNFIEVTWKVDLMWCDMKLVWVFRVQYQTIIFVISGDLMFHLNRILFSPHLKTIVTWEVTLFLIIKFLYKLVAMINSNRLCTTTLSLSSVKNYHKCFLKDFCNFKTSEILTQIQREFIQIWMCLLLWQICILFGNFSSQLCNKN